MKFKLCFLLFPLFFLDGAAVATAQQYPFQTYTELEGLPSSAVYDLVQDDQGQMWFTTRAGLVSYDGQQWVPRSRADGLPDIFFAQLEQDDLGRIWTVSLNPPFSVAYREHKRWVVLPRLETPSASASINNFKIGRHPDGSLLAAMATDNGFVCIWDGHRWRHIEQHTTFGSVQTLMFAGDRLLIASAYGFFALDLTTWQLIPDPLPGLPNGTVRTIASAGPESPLWLIGDHWIGRHNGDRFALLAENLEFSLPVRNRGVSTLLDQVGGLYFGDNSCLYYFRPPGTKLERLDTTSGYSAGGVSSLFEDREGNIWFSSLRGLRKLEDRRFTHFDQTNGLFNDEVSAILFRKSHTVVLGHVGGLTFLDPHPSTLALAGRSEVPGRVMSLAEDREGALWVAYDKSGLARISASGDTTWYGQNEGMPQPAYTVHVDDTDQVWVGTNAGLFRRHGERFSRVSLPGMDDPPSRAFVRNILPGREGAILVVSGVQGVYRVLGEQIQRWIRDGNPDESCYTAYERPDGQLLIGTSHGLFQTEGDGMIRTTAPDPVIDRPIYSIVADGAGRLWFGTDGGVQVWDGQNLRRYTPREGLLGSETNRDALQLDHRNRVWIGTDRGLSVFTPEFDLPPLADPIVEFLNFEVDGGTHELSAALELDQPPHSLIARYRGISFRNTGNLGVSTWLENFESSWQPSQPWPQRFTRYTNLSPGRYRLHLRVESLDGFVGDVVTSPEIVIGKPFWLRWWFMLLELGGGLLVLRIALSFYANRRYAQRLDAEIKTRTQELHASEQAARLESQRFSATLNSVSECVLTLDADEKIVLCNPATEVVLGQPAAGLLGKHVTEILAGFPEVTATAASQHEYENPLRGTVWLETTSAPLTADTGQPAGTVLVLRDVTARRLRDDELVRGQKLESLGLLAGGIAHDFNNLLTIIRGNIDLAKEEPGLPPQSLAKMDNAKRASIRAGSLAKQLLTFARGGAPQQQLASLTEIVQQAVSLAFSGTAHSCRVDIADELWPVDVDPGQMSQVFNNIFINASQAMTTAGSVHITGRNVDPAPPSLPPGRYVLVEIRDEGCGISEANLNKVFDPYFTTKEKGSGLGLATAFSIVKRHNGFLTVESESGRGTTFRIYLPPGTGEPAAEDQHQVAPVTSGQRILVMDDEADVLLIIEGFLARMGLESVLTADGQQAIDAYVAARASGRPFAAVLCDLTVPGELGGKETIARLQKLDPGVKAIVISGYSQDAVVADYRRHGFAGALAKPFGYDQLAAVLGEVLGGG